jgi:hypothetical protein
MAPILGTTGQGKVASKTGRASTASPALEWFWQFAEDLRNPRVLDCGPARQANVQALLRRGAKVYLADLVSPVLHDEPGLWDRKPKIPVFQPQALLDRVPRIPPASLSLIFAWQLLDLVAPAALAPVVEFLAALLEPKGALFCILREPYLREGVETLWRLDGLTALATEGDARRAFPYPAITNREMERLFASGSVKTFLTRTGRREILAVR